MRYGIKARKHRPNRRERRSARYDRALSFLREATLKLFAPVSWKDLPIPEGAHANAINTGIIWTLNMKDGVDTKA